MLQFTVMSYGLCNVPATFDRLMGKVLRKILFKICLIYLDIIVFSQMFEDMMANLRTVFLRFHSNNLKINPKKYSLLEKQVKYLGHVVSEMRIITDPEKVSAIKNWPIPRTKRYVQSFLEFCLYYRKFVKGFSLIAKPLLIESQVKIE